MGLHASTTSSRLSPERAARTTLGLAALAAAVAAAVAPAGAQEPGDPTLSLRSAVAAAEARLSADDTAGAEGYLRRALFEGSMLLGTLERLEGRVEDARRSLARAAAFAPADPAAALALASAQLQAGDAAGAAAVLEAGAGARDLEATRVLARAQAAAGRHEAALGTLAQGLAAAPDDPEVAYVIAGEYLWLKQLDAAERLFARVVERRPLALTHVLVGRAYRDAGQYERARRELGRALELDPSVRRAHYYLGTIAVADPTPGPERQETAIAEFREELRVAGEDPLVLDQLGTALVEAGRPAEAVPLLERALVAEPRAAYALDLGRAQLAAGQAAAAVASLRRALQLSSEQGAGEGELEKIHYQLGIALHRTGAAEEAKGELAEARRLAARWTDPSRRVTTVGAAGGSGSRPGTASAAVGESSPLARVPEAQRRALGQQVRTLLAQCSLNLGVIETRREQPARAVELFEAAAELDAALPRVQAALGVARYNAGAFAEATGPLSLAVASDPDDAVLRRMLALAWLNTGAAAKAAPLLEADPELTTDPQLRLALGIAYRALGRAEQAQEQFRAYEGLTGRKPF